MHLYIVLYYRINFSGEVISVLKPEFHKHPFLKMARNLTSLKVAYIDCFPSFSFPKFVGQDNIRTPTG